MVREGKRICSRSHSKQEVQTQNQGKEVAVRSGDSVLASAAHIQKW